MKETRLLIFLGLLIIGSLGLHAQERIIFDSDMSSDHDDAADLAVLNGLADLGECQILACMASSQNGATALAFNSINTYYGRPNVPCGRRPDCGGLGMYPATIQSEYVHPLYATYLDPPLCVNLYRQVLAAQPDHSVSIVTTGYMNNLQALMQSGPDGYSSLSGMDLIRQKVKLLACAGGCYPAGDEFNLRVEPAAANYVINNWPTSACFDGYDVGQDIYSSWDLQQTGTFNPIRRAFELTFFGAYPTWGQLMIYYAVRTSESQSLWKYNTTGHNNCDATGHNWWSTETDPSGAQEQGYMLEIQRYPIQEAINTLVMNSGAPQSRGTVSPPNKPSNLRGTAVGSNRIDLQWTDNSWNETGFTIERAINNVFTPIATVGAGVTSYSDTGLSTTHNVDYRLKANNAIGSSAFTTVSVYSGGWTEYNETNPSDHTPVYYYYQNNLNWARGANVVAERTINMDSQHGQDLTVNVMVGGQGGYGRYYIYFFYQDANNWYRVNTGSVGQGQANYTSKFEKCINGTITQIGTTGEGVNISNGSYMDTWQLVVSHTGALQFFTNDNKTGLAYSTMHQVLNVSDNLSFSTGLIGLIGLGSDMGQPVWDNFSFITGNVVSVPVTGISLSPTSTSMNVGGSQQLTSTVLPSNATNKTVSWSSGNPSIAQVSSNGLVTGVAAGSATITATTQDGGKTATCVITVSASQIPVTGVSLTPSSASVAAGSTQQLTATVAPSNATNPSVSWSSSNTGIATVNSSGLVTGIAAGSATITVTTQDGSKTATGAITVTSGGGGSSKLAGTVIGTPYDGYSPIANAFDGNTGTYSENVTTNAWEGLDLGSGQQITTVKYFPRAGWTGRMTSGKFQGSNTADFSSGVADLYTIATQPAEGWNQATITNTTSFRYVRYVTPANGYLNVAEIEFYGAGGTGTVAVTGVTMSPTTASVAVSGTQQLTATVAPSNATNPSVSWSSSNTGIATVNSSGLVTGIAAGSATITVTTQDGSKTATGAITVTSGGGGSSKLAGTVIGTPYDGYSPIANAFDGNTGTYSENVTTNAWEGLDLGSGQQITTVKYFPRAGWTGRMTSGKFQGSNTADFSSGVADLYTIASQPAEGWNQATITNTTSFRYVRYVTPANGYLNVAEIEFYGAGGTGTVAVTGVTMSPTTASVAVSGTQQLTATVAPSNATNKSVSWSSGNTGIATVNSSGLVTGIAAGSATITVTSQDGSKTATCAITVTSGDSSGKLTGTVIGTSGSYDATSTIDKAYDGNTSTYVDNLTSGAWAGLDLGSGQQITSIKYFPRSGWASRMVGGKFQGSGVADFSSAVVDLYTVPTEPPVSCNEIAITNTSSFRYVRYLTPDYGYCNVAEIEFYGTGKSSVKSAMTMADQVFTENMIVSPNPATNVINISGDVYEVRIYSLHGNLIMSVYRSNSLDVSSLSKGLYIVRINDVHGNQRSVKLEIR